MARWGIPGHLAMSALEGIRTPNLLIRSQMLYPLSYERIFTCERALLYISPFFRAKRTGVFIVTWSAFHIIAGTQKTILRARKEFMRRNYYSSKVGTITARALNVPSRKAR